ncbi:MAG: hypothetical protein ACRD40_18570 [Candidatus Acidiferrales bacterium]
MHASRFDSSITDEAVRLELGHLLVSPEFKSSKRCQDFLKFVVERTLSGLTDTLKERTIGIEVFGRHPSYDTSADGIVRINATEVRKRLAIHYAAPDRASEVRVSLPVGNYVPVFSGGTKPPGNGDASHLHEGPVHDSHLVRTVPLTHEHSLQIPKSQRKMAIWMAATILVAVAISVSWLNFHHPANIVDQFWQPLFQGSNPVLIIPTYVPTYDSATNPPSGTYTLMTDQYVGGGDLVAAVEVSSMLVRLGHPFNLRMGMGVSLDELRNTPTVLIGYSSTQWEDVTKKFRFFIDDASLGMVRDYGKPTDWYPHHETPQHHTDEDYAVISRAFDPETRSMLILVSGCMQYGTEAAARLITSPDQLSAALRGAPKDWPGKNLQLVIHVDVVANSPASTKVVASYYW